LSKQVLNAQTFSDAHTQELTRGRAVTRTMTYGGTIARSLFLVIITIGFAAVGWQWAARVATTSGMWFFLGYILTTGIAISVVISIVAAMSLIADFAVVETGVTSGAPAAFEWYAAFGLQTTLVWLYLEILYLLARIRGNA
jgi:uncharacterized YccA/Bax inhibitor family protein